jgi:hypothetical protein
MKKQPLYVLGCDIDCSEHGIHGSLEKCYEEALKLIEKQCYNDIEVSLKDYYATIYVEGEPKGEVIDLEKYHDRRKKKYNFVLARYWYDEPDNNSLCCWASGSQVHRGTKEEAEQWAKELSEEQELEYKAFYIQTDRD